MGCVSLSSCTRTDYRLARPGTCNDEEDTRRGREAQQQWISVYLKDAVSRLAPQVSKLTWMETVSECG
jgi:hypothetical protein